MTCVSGVTKLLGSSLNETTRGPKVCHVTKSPLALLFRLNVLSFFVFFFFLTFSFQFFTQYSTFSPLTEMTSSFVNELFLTCISSLEHGASDEHGYGHHSYITVQSMNMVMYISHRYSTEQAMRRLWISMIVTVRTERYQLEAVI